MRIGELSRQSGVPSTTLRYYEQAGLLAAPRRTASGYRAYDGETLNRLAFIRAAQSVGLTLAEIRDVMAIRDGGRAPCQHVQEIVDRRRAEVRTRIADLRRLEADLARVSRAAAALDPAECEPSGICGAIPAELSARDALAGVGRPDDHRTPPARRAEPASVHAASGASDSRLGTRSHPPARHA
ncbi:MAG: heavy metal-responsive transcriptional regulator [Candidatus Limnocylindrales bacterium]